MTPKLKAPNMALIIANSILWPFKVEMLAALRYVPGDMAQYEHRIREALDRNELLKIAAELDALAIREAA